MEIHKAKPLGFKTITLGDFIRSFDVFHNCIHKINIYEYKTCKFLGEIKKYFSPEKSYYYVNNPLYKKLIYFFYILYNHNNQSLRIPKRYVHYNNPAL